MRRSLDSYRTTARESEALVVLDSADRRLLDVERKSYNQVR
jgi:hypothetical protein